MTNLRTSNWAIASLYVAMFRVARVCEALHPERHPALRLGVQMLRAHKGLSLSSHLHEANLPLQQEPSGARYEPHEPCCAPRYELQILCSKMLCLGPSSRQNPLLPPRVPNFVRIVFCRLYSFGYGRGYVCVFTREIFFVGFHEFRREIRRGVFDGAEHNADIFSSSFCHFARFLHFGFFCAVLPTNVPAQYRHMSPAVDTCNQLALQWREPNRFPRWPMAVRAMLLRYAVWNAFAICKQAELVAPCETMRDFQWRIIKAVLPDVPEWPVPVHCPVAGDGDSGIVNTVVAGGPHGSV